MAANTFIRVRQIVVDRLGEIRRRARESGVKLTTSDAVERAIRLLEIDMERGGGSDSDLVFVRGAADEVLGWLAALIGVPNTPARLRRLALLAFGELARRRGEDNSFWLTDEAEISIYETARNAPDYSPESGGEST